MNADWRVTVRIDGKSRGSRAILHGKVAAGLRARLDGLADVSADGYRLFVYTQTEALAGEAAQAALQLAGEHGLAPQIALDRWDADVSEWQSGSGPASGPEWAEGKHAREVAEDARRSEATGVPQWTVRVTLPSRQDAVRLSGWLQSVGIPAVRSRKWVLLGAADEDVARELERLRTEQAPGPPRKKTGPISRSDGANNARRHQPPASLFLDLPSLSGRASARPARRGCPARRGASGRPP